MKQEKDLTGEIVIYQPDETIRLEVKIEDETVWLSQQPLNGSFSHRQSRLPEQETQLSCHKRDQETYS